MTGIKKEKTNVYFILMSKIEANIFSLCYFKNSNNSIFVGEGLNNFSWKQKIKLKYTEIDYYFNLGGCTLLFVTWKCNPREIILRKNWEIHAPL